MRITDLNTENINEISPYGGHTHIVIMELQDHSFGFVHLS